ncbi:energy conserving hydrogenase EhbF [Methanobacterium alcaliphilum]|uniref:energy conserving hydrogenase EhbF n=1 Tax=Methanobacterium alcaliphilum TaxID=392018 RepID=UPI00200B5CA9|nr:energy conserving hydrogenase EhbF [Methanobacterium alcaliphilum]MCK9151444.1 energy conserving hydrogenase EhbF [Methanobacterium alcaliphilum]
MNPLIPIMVIMPIACALLLNLLHKKDRTVKILALTVGIILPIIPLLATYGMHYFGGYAPLVDSPALSQGLPSIITSTALNLFHPAITYSFATAQKVFIFILGLIAFFAIFTSLSETRKPSGVYTFLMFMGTAAITAILLSDDIFNLYVFFEIAALAQVGIILCSNVEKNYETALKYMILGGIAAPMLLLGIAILLGITGNVNITDIVFSIKSGLVDPNNPLLLFACGLILFGWLYGSGLPPFHTIKSAVYSKALPHGAALLQAFSVFTFVALGIIIIRVFYYLPLTKWAVVFFSLMAMILGITMALMQTDFKRIIGYLAVGELGYIGLGLGLGTAFGITAGLFQAVNEAIITAFLFIGFGTVLYKTGTSDTSKLGGLLADNPWVAGLVLLAGFAMAGVPPFNAFQSKLQLVQASISAGIPELGIIMVLLSIVTFMTFVKAFYTIYLRPRPAALEIKNEKIPKATIISLVALLVICVVLGLFPQLATGFISPLAQGLI